MTKLMKFTLTILLFFFTAFNARAAFEYQHWGARAKALGQAITADSEPTFWNPATLVGQGGEISYAYTDQWNLNIPVNMASLLLPIGNKLTVGLRGNIFHDAVSEVKEQSISLAGAIKFSKGLQVGFTFNRGLFSFQEVTGQQTSFDLGAIKKLGSRCQGGIVLRNFWSSAHYSTGREERAPKQFVFGFAGELTPQLRMLVDCTESHLRLGIEKHFTENFALQAGWQRDLPSIGLEVTNGNLSCNYAFSPEPMGNGHLLSMTYSW